MPRVSKNSGDTHSERMLGSRPAATGLSRKRMYGVTLKLIRSNGHAEAADSTPGSARRRVEQSIVESVDGRHGVVALAGLVEIEGQQVGRAVAGVDPREHAHAADHQAGADQQHHRERHLGGNQRPAQLSTGAARSCARSV